MQPTNLQINDKKLNDAAELLMICIPDHASELIHELAKEYLIPPWQVFAGVVLEMHLRGMLSGFSLDPSWAEGVMQRKYICKRCEKNFQPLNVGQLYCSNECGLAATVQPNIEDHKDVTKPLNTPAPEPKSVDSDEFVNRISKLIKKTDSAGWDGAPSVTD